MTTGKIGSARRSVLDAINGDTDKVDPALRRAIIALAEHQDQQCAQRDADNMEIMEVIESNRVASARISNRIIALLITATMTFFTNTVTGVVIGIIN